MTLVSEKTHENQFVTLTAHSECGSEKNISHSDIALNLLREIDIGLVDAARLCLELVEEAGGCTDISVLRRIILLGGKMRRKEKNTVSFSRAVERCLEMKRNRSERTLRDIRQTMSKLMQCNDELATTPLRSICTVDCTRILNSAYAHSPSRFIKARANLSGVFSVAHKLGWCSGNPVKAVFIPSLKEKEIKPLTLAEIKRLFTAARLPDHQDCIPALALMLYAGVRPDEVRRLHWADIDWEENVLYMAVRHTKTGGGRHVPLCSYLVQLLRAHKNMPQKRICPPRWAQRWRFLRQAAGFTHWVADSLRHSYASYHAKYYRDLPRLQLAMGHRDVQLLLTRYVNLRGITRATAQRFWQGVFLENQ